jgi:hypothetical protein
LSKHAVHGDQTDGGAEGGADAETESCWKEGGADKKAQDRGPQSGTTRKERASQANQSPD